MRWPPTREILPYAKPLDLPEELQMFLASQLLRLLEGLRKIATGIASGTLYLGDPNVTILLKLTCKRQLHLALHPTSHHAHPLTAFDLAWAISQKISHAHLRKISHAHLATAIRMD